MKLRKIFPVVLFILCLICVLANPKLLFLVGVGAVITGSPLGNWKNKLNNIVLFNWKGINAARSYVIPTYSNTEPQQGQRNLFKQIIFLAQGCKSEIIDTFWYNTAIKMSAFNAFVKRNLFSMTSPTDYENMILSKGSLTSTSIVSAVKSSSTITCEWSETLSGNQEATDKAFLSAFNRTTLRWYFLSGDVERSTGSADVIVPESDTATDFQVYLFFYRDLNLPAYIISDSDHIVASA